MWVVIDTIRKGVMCCESQEAAEKFVDEQIKHHMAVGDLSLTSPWAPVWATDWQPGHCVFFSNKTSFRG